MRTIEDIDKELFAIQQARMDIINQDNVRFAKLEESIKELEISNNAQIKVNQLFHKQTQTLQEEINALEIRLNNLKPFLNELFLILRAPKVQLKEEIKPLVSIPSLVPSAWNVPQEKGFSIVNWFKRK